MKDANKPLLSSYHIVINSMTKRIGDWQSGHYKVDIGDVLDPKKQWNIAVQSFHVFDAVSGEPVAPLTPFSINSATIPQGNTYTSMTDGLNQQLALIPPVEYFVSPAPTYNTVGRRLMDVSFLRGTLININLQDSLNLPLSPALFGFTDSSKQPAWILELVVWETSDGSR